MKKKSIYYRKLKRILRAALLEMDTLESMTVDEACTHFKKLAFDKRAKISPNVPKGDRVR